MEERQEYLYLLIMNSTQRNNIIVCGDIHGDWGPLNRLIKREKPEIILQCGDLGYWPNLSMSGRIKDILNGPTKIYWCDGNHENHWELSLIREEGVSQLEPNIFYMKRGSTLVLPDKRRVLFMGGAASVDRVFRKLGLDWFPDEVISQSDIEGLPDVDIDIVISHTCPMEIFPRIEEEAIEYYPWFLKMRDPSQEALSYVYNKYRPPLWYFGHFHMYYKLEYEDTVFTCLDFPGNMDTWWEYLT